MVPDAGESGHRGLHRTVASDGEGPRDLHVIARDGFCLKLGLAPSDIVTSGIVSERKTARVPRPTVGGGEARMLGCVPISKYRDALLWFGTYVIGLAKPAHPLRGKTRCAGPVSRPREGADAHGHTRHGSNRRPLLRWHLRCVRVLLVPRESPQGRARAELNSPSVVQLAPRQRPRRSHGPPRPWYFTPAVLIVRSLRVRSFRLHQ